MTNFKVGDKVKYIGTQIETNHLIIGNTYTIVKISEFESLNGRFKGGFYVEPKEEAKPSSYCQHFGINFVLVNRKPLTFGEALAILDSQTKKEEVINE